MPLQSHAPDQQRGSGQLADWVEDAAVLVMAVAVIAILAAVLLFLIII